MSRKKLEIVSSEYAKSIPGTLISDTMASENDVKGRKSIAMIVFGIGRRDKMKGLQGVATFFKISPVLII